MTDYEENRLALELQADTGMTIALHTADPGEVGSASELSGGGYAQKPITFTVTGSSALNAALIRWDALTATVTHFSIKKGANTKHVGAFSSAIVLAGNPLEIPIGQLTISWD
jgi:hypothetical protein